MQDLEGHYKNGEPKLRLIRGHKNKLQWKVIESKVNIQNTIPQSLNELDLSTRYFYFPKISVSLISK